MVCETAVLDAHNPLLSIRKWGDKLLALDNCYTLYIYDSAYTLLNQRTFIKDMPPLHPYNKACTFTMDGKFLYPYADKPRALLIAVVPKLAVAYTFTAMYQTLESSAVSTKNRYLALGETSGRTTLYDALTQQFITALAPRPDYISAIIFSDDERYIVSASYDKSTQIFDLILEAEVAMLHTLDVIESAVFFDDNTKIALIARNGNLQVYDFVERRITIDKNLFVAWPTKIVLFWDQKHLLVSMKNGTVCAIDTLNFAIVMQYKFNDRGIVNLTLLDKILLVHTVEGKTPLIDTAFNQEPFEAAIGVRDMAKVQALLRTNSFLLLNENYNATMMEEFAPLFDDVFALLEKGDLEGAKARMAPFGEDPTIAQEFEKIATNASKIQELAEHVKNKRLSQACAMLDKYNFLKNTPAAVTFERYWQKSYNQAKQLCMNNDVVSFKQAQKVLEPFAKIEGKQKQVFALFKNIKLFIQAETLIKNGRFGAYFAMANANSAIKESDTYTRLLDKGQEQLGKFVQSVKRNDFGKAKQELLALEEFTPLHPKLRPLKAELMSRVKFFDAIRNKDYDTAFTLAKEFSFLRLSNEYKEIEKSFTALSKEALGLAFAGDGEGVLARFEPYRNIGLFADKIAALLRIAYLNQIKQHANDTTIDWKGLFERYTEYFGKNDELIHTAKQINQEAVLQKIEKGDEQGYKKMPLVGSLFVSR